VRLLAIDTGTGTQDVLLFDTADLVENSVKLVLPSPTLRVADRVRQAGERGAALLFTGLTMGGGPCAWALERHLSAGLAAFATPDAARTFDDDLEAVAAMGVRLVGEDEAAGIDGVERIDMRDLDLDSLRAGLARLGVDPHVDGLALACLDHGAAPPGYSDRLFRFEHLRRVVEKDNDLLAFAYEPQELPPYLTRARALVDSAAAEAPTVFLDTAPAAALGALQDPIVAGTEEQLILNLGNSHALAFHLRGTHIYSLFEHHTGLLDRDDIDSFAERLLAGVLTQDEVFGGNGHGVCYVDRPTGGEPLIAVTGPQRGKLLGSRLRPHFAVPHGDMMLSGCFGLVQAFAAKHPAQREEIERRLGAEISEKATP
jgi:uncharacterized protein (DUF1786 family)